jgi:rod shape determining protein RodA
VRDLTLGDRLRRADWLLLGLALLLTLVGMAAVKVASEGQPTDYGWLQVRWTVISVAACLLVLAVPYRRVVELRWPLYGAGLLLLVLVLFKGSGKSAGRWIEVGSFRVQPSEFMKLVLVIALAGYIRYEKGYKEFRGLAVPFAMTLVPLLLVMKQPDLGTALLFLPILFVMLYVAGARPRHLGVLGLLGLLAGLVLFTVPGLLQNYQKARFLAFLHRGSDTAFLNQSHNHQLHQSETVVGTAGLLGLGTGEEAEEAVRFLPERHTDFAFPVLVTVFGLAGTTVFLLLYLLFLALLVRASLRVREPSGRLLAVGIGVLFASQAVINMAMAVGLLPIVGVTLPFVSYGGSSLLTSFLGLGLVLNLGADSPMEFGRGDFE